MQKTLLDGAANIVVVSYLDLALSSNSSPLLEPTSAMRILIDCFGREVRLTDERLAHILERPELEGVESEIQLVLSKPQLVRPSRSDATVQLFYGFYSQTLVGGKWLCVVVKYEHADAFVVTAYLTNKPKAGEDLWPKK